MTWASNYVCAVLGTALTVWDPYGLYCLIHLSMGSSRLNILEWIWCSPQGIITWQVSNPHLSIAGSSSPLEPPGEPKFMLEAEKKKRKCWMKPYFISCMVLYKTGRKWSVQRDVRKIFFVENHVKYCNLAIKPFSVTNKTFALENIKHSWKRWFFEIFSPQMSNIKATHSDKIVVKNSIHFEFFLKCNHLSKLIHPFLSEASLNWYELLFDTFWVYICS